MIVYATFRSNLLMILKTSKKDYTKLLSTMQALRKALPCSYIPQKETKQHIFGQNPCVQGGWRHCNYSRLLSTVRLVWCLRLVRFWQLRLQSDCQRWQTQLAGREERTLRQRAPNVHLNRLAQEDCPSTLQVNGQNTMGLNHKCIRQFTTEAKPHRFNIIRWKHGICMGRLFPIEKLLTRPMLAIQR